MIQSVRISWTICFLLCKNEVSANFHYIIVVRYRRWTMSHRCHSTNRFFYYEISCFCGECDCVLSSWSAYLCMALNRTEKLNGKIGTYDTRKNNNNFHTKRIHSFIHSNPDPSSVCLYASLSNHLQFLHMFRPFICLRLSVNVCVLFSGSGQVKIIITKTGDTRLGKTITRNEYSIDTRERKRKNPNRRWRTMQQKKIEMTEDAVCLLIDSCFVCISLLLSTLLFRETGNSQIRTNTHAHTHEQTLIS